MKERPIIFKAEMVRAIIDGTKTQTRRVVKPAKDRNGSGCNLAPCEIAGDVNGGDYSLCPYGQPGDRLWVRETHGFWPSADSERREDGVIYRATDDDWECRMFDWRPSIHMPRWASRITLEITSVRVERLQDISEADAVAEGVKNTLHLQGGRFANENFAHLWWVIHGDGAWESNPWVWVIEFKKLEEGAA